MRLLLEGCYGYLLVPSLITKHPFHQFSTHQFPCSSISDDFNNQPMGYIRCYALVSEIFFFPLEILVGGCGSVGGILRGNYTHQAATS